jgi:ribosomal protein S2
MKAIIRLFGWKIGEVEFEESPPEIRVVTDALHDIEEEIVEGRFTPGFLTELEESLNPRESIEELEYFNEEKEMDRVRQERM